MDNSVVFEKQEEKTKASLSPAIIWLLEKYQEAIISARPKGEVATIHVDEIASKLAFVYERIRKIIDWKEENLLRRAAIERILKRRLISKISGVVKNSLVDTEKIAELMVLELIRGGHFPNDKIPRTKIIEVEKVLKKYTYVLENNPLEQDSASLKIKTKINFYNWVLEIAACEIEETIQPSLKENALIDLMVMVMEQRIRIDPRISLAEEEKKKQIYIAVHHSLFHLDASIICYRLLKFKYPQWVNHPPELIVEVAKNILGIWEEMENELIHPLSADFHKICEKYDTVFLIISDVLEQFSQDPATLVQKFTNHALVEESFRKAYDKRRTTLKSRLFRLAVWSTFSIFFAGAVSLFIVEVPLAALFYGRFSLFAMFIDIVIPTVAMFLMVIAVKLPDEANLKRVMAEIAKTIYQNEEKDIYEIRQKKKRGMVVMIIIGLLYTIISIISLWLTFMVFYIARIPTTSLILDTLNLAMIVFAGLLIRQRAKEMTIEEKSTFWEFGFDMLSIPVGKLGQWLSRKWREYNIIGVFLTALIDTPISALVEFTESWSSFLKEKRAEIQ